MELRINRVRINRSRPVVIFHFVYRNYSSWVLIKRMNCNIQRYKIQWMVITIGHSIRSDNNVSIQSSLLLPLPMFAFFIIISHHIVDVISCLRQYALNSLLSAL